MSSRPDVLALTAKHKDLMTKEKELRTQGRNAKRAHKKREERERTALRRKVDLGVTTLAMLAPDLGIDAQVLGREAGERRVGCFHREGVRQVSVRS